MVTHDLMKAFQKKYPQYKRIYWQTLPPGIEAQQIEQGALVVGSLRIALQPDVYTRGHKPHHEDAEGEGLVRPHGGLRPQPSGHHGLQGQSPSTSRDSRTWAATT